MAKVNELNLKSVKMADGSDVYIAVLFTLSDEYLEDVSEKKQNRYWGTFSKKYGRDISKKNYYVSTDINYLSEKDDYSDKEVVAITNLESLTAIDERDKDNLDFGLRLMKDEKLLLIDQSITNDLNNKELNRGLTFDEVEEEHDKLRMYLKKRVEEKLEMQAQEEEEKESEDAKRLEQTISPENDGMADDIQKEIEKDGDNKSDVKDEQPTNNIGENSEEDYIYVDQEQAQLSKEEERALQLANFRKELYEYIDSQIPRPNLLDIDVANIFSDIDYKGYKDLYLITQNSIEKKINHEQAVLQQQRKDIIDTIYRTVESELIKRYGSNIRLSDYKKDDGEFSHIYKQVVKDYEEVIASLEDHRKSKEDLLNEQFNINKRNYVASQTKKAEEEFEKINRPKIKEELDKYIEGISAAAEESREVQLAILEEDIYMETERRNNILIQDIIKDFNPVLTNAISNFKELMTVSMTETKEKMQKEVATLIDRIQEVEKKRIESEKLADDTINAKVKERTSDYSQLRDKISTLENEVYNKNKALMDMEQEKMRKDNQLVSASEERKMLIDDKEYHKKTADDLREELNKLRVLQLESMKDFSQNPQNNIRATTIENKKNKGEKLTFSEKLDTIDRKLYNLVGATLIGASLLGSALIIGGGDEANSAEEVKALEQKIEKQQKQIDEAKSIEEQRQQKELEDAKAEEAKSLEEARSIEKEKAEKEKAEKEKAKEKK